MRPGKLHVESHGTIILFQDDVHRIQSQLFLREAQPGFGVRQHVNENVDFLVHQFLRTAQSLQLTLVVQQLRFQALLLILFLRSILQHRTKSRPLLLQQS